jgi:hypothetical protein
VALEILHGPFMFLRCGEAAESPEILAFAGFGVFLSGMNRQILNFRWKRMNPRSAIGALEQPIGFLIAHDSLMRGIPIERPA